MWDSLRVNRRVRFDEKNKTNSHVLSFFKKISTIEKLKVNFKNKMPNSSLDGWFYEEQTKNWEMVAKSVNVYKMAANLFLS